MDFRGSLRVLRFIVDATLTCTITHGFPPSLTAPSIERSAALIYQTQPTYRFVPILKSTAACCCCVLPPHIHHCSSCPSAPSASAVFQSQRYRLPNHQCLELVGFTPVLRLERLLRFHPSSLWEHLPDSFYFVLFRIVSAKKIHPKICSYVTGKSLCSVNSQKRKLNICKHLLMIRECPESLTRTNVYKQTESKHPRYFSSMKTLCVWCIE